MSTGANSFGSRLILTSFGESHGGALGAVIDGVPAGVIWDDELLLSQLDRRKPGQSAVVSSRTEADKPEILSGVYQGKTLGTPIAMFVRNEDARSIDYKEIAEKPRVGHADDVWKNKFGHSDPRGGGRASGRETVSRVMGGAVAQMILRTLAPKLKVTGFVRQIGTKSVSENDIEILSKSPLTYPADSLVARFPSLSQNASVEKLLLDAKNDGHSYGGVAEIWVDGVPPGLGQPVFHKLKSDLAYAYMSLGASTGVELGAGFDATLTEGSEFHSLNLKNDDRYGGLRGGISTGERIVYRVVFKPTSSVLDVAKKGRHDPCIVPRAVPVLEAMTYLVLADHALWARSDRVDIT